MTEKIKKTEIIEKYPLGDGDFINLIKSPEGYYSCYGSVAGKNIPMDKQYKYAGCARKNALKHIASAEIDHLNKSIKCGEIVLRAKEGGLEKASKDLGGEEIKCRT